MGLRSVALLRRRCAALRCGVSGVGALCAMSLRVWGVGLRGSDAWSWQPWRWAVLCACVRIRVVLAHSVRLSAVIMRFVLFCLVLITLGWRWLCSVRSKCVWRGLWCALSGIDG